ncbi:MAG: sulfatase-like hydrolase/transferase [Blastocatellales bacterium]
MKKDIIDGPDGFEPKPAEGRSARNELPPAVLLLLAALFGVFTGLIESALLGVQKLISARALLLGPRVIWMVPVADLLLFAAVGLLALGVSWRLRGLRSARMAMIVFGFLASLSWLLIFPRIQWYASVLLAIGAAGHAGRFFARRLRPPYSFIYRAIKIVAAAALILTIGVEGRSWWKERQYLANLPPVAANAPNVLLIVMDTVRAQSMSLYGYERETTPQLERFAKLGVRFERAISTAPWTTPSHAGMFTGRYPSECSTDWDQPMDGRSPTLAEALRTHGYATAGFVANAFGCGYETGLDRGFIHYEDYSITFSELLLSSSLIRAIVHSDPLRWLLGKHQVVTRKTAAEINHDFLAWRQRQTSRPFFAFLNYLDAHEPYLPPPPFDRKFGMSPHTDQYFARHDLRISFRYGRDRLSATETQAEMDGYDGAIAYLDQQIGLLLEELEKRGTLKNTLVVITSDHGESFGEHKDYGHGNSLYMSLLRVPLLIYFPSRAPANQRVAMPITLRDLPATILDLAGVGDTLRIPGHSLAFHWGADPLQVSSASSPVLAEVNVAPIRPGRYPSGATARMYSVLQEQHHYIRNANGREELYDIMKDPAEQTSLEYKEELQHLMEQFRCVSDKLHSYCPRI